MLASVGLLDEVRGELDRLNGADFAALSPSETEQLVHDLRAVQAQLAAIDAKAARKFELDREWARSGALNPAAYLGAVHRVPSSKCRRQFTIGRQLAELPGLVLALEATAIGLAHRDKILAIDNPRVHDALVADHVTMVRWAKSLPWKQFERNLLDWLAEHDQDGPDPGVDGRHFNCSRTMNDRRRVDGMLDVIGGTVFENELNRLVDVLFKADWTEAKQRLGRDPVAGELRRTATQRRADALVWMVERSAIEPGDDRRGRFLFTVFVGQDAWLRMCELTNGIQARPSQLVPYLGDRAVFETILVDGRFRDISASEQRTYTGALRRAVLGRAGGCEHDFCDKPADECQVDHYKPHSKGGPTTYEMGRGACAGHNRAKGAFDPTANPDDVDDP